MKPPKIRQLTSMDWHYGRLCVLLILTILLGLPLREAGRGSVLFGLLIVLVSYAAANAAGETRAACAVGAPLTNAIVSPIATDEISS